MDFKIVVGLSQAPGETGRWGRWSWAWRMTLSWRPGEVGESALEPVSFGLSLTGLAVVDGGEISFEEVVLGERLVDPPPSRGTGMSNRS